MRRKILWAVIRSFFTGHCTSTSVGKVDYGFTLINENKTYVHVRYQEGHLYD